MLCCWKKITTNRCCYSLPGNQGNIRSA